MDKSYDIVMIGSEEGWFVHGSGQRSVSLPSLLSHSACVEKVLVVNCPKSIPNRIKSKLTGETPLEGIYPEVVKKQGVSLLRVNQKMYLLSLTSFFPESDNFISKIDRCVLTGKIKNIMNYLHMDCRLL